jgi:excisionase family DNA binding protein
MTPTPDYVRIRQAVSLLRERAGHGPAPIGERTIRRAIRAGELPGYRVGNRVLVSIGDIDRWLSAQRIEPQPPPEDRARARVREQLRHEAAL